MKQVFVALLVFGGSPAIASTPSLVEGEVVVRYERGVETLGRALLVARGLVVTPAVPQLGADLARSPLHEPVRSLVAGLRGLVWLKSVEPNGVFHVCFEPNDTEWPLQWGPVKMACPGAWDIERGRSSTAVAVVDTGVDVTHQDLSGKLVAGWNVFGNNANTDDPNGHGTVMAGIACAATNNAKGIAGVGFDCSVQPVRVTNDAGGATTVDLANGILWASEHGAQVVLIGLGGPTDTSVLKDAVDTAWSRGVVLVAPAGSSGTPTYPAYYDKCIAVAASDSADHRASFSNYGTGVDVAAPGVNIRCTVPRNAYAYYSGTSMAAAHVGGLAALVCAHKGNVVTNTEVRARIERGCDPVTYVEFGRVNARRSLMMTFPVRAGNDTVH